MIEKLDIIKDTENMIKTDGLTANIAKGSAIKKINELIDIVNKLHEEAKSNAVTRADHEHKLDELQKNIDRANCAILDLVTPKEPTDPYIEQRKWIGSLCKFKMAQGYCYGILTGIKKRPAEYCFEALGRAFKTCEPVDPDDLIIYRR